MKRLKRQPVKIVMLEPKDQNAFERMHGITALVKTPTGWRSLRPGDELLV